MKTRIIEKPAQHFSKKTMTPKWIIIHAIGFSEEQALEILTGDHKVSAHYFIPQHHKTERDTCYPIYQLVADHHVAYHAGSSYWQNLSAFNDFSIGIEFHSPNYAYAQQNPNQLNWYHFEKFLDEQVEAGISLIKNLMTKYAIHPHHILTHADIAPYRQQNDAIILGKTDPGALFPMEALAKEGIGRWPAFNRTRHSPLDFSIQYTQHLLQQIGYSIKITNELDLATLFVIKAFKIHFMPEEYTHDEVNSRINERMIIGLENLVDDVLKYNLFYPTTQKTF